MRAGGALHLHGRAAHLIAEHSQAANILAFMYVAFTALVIVAFASQRISEGCRPGLVGLDRALARPQVFSGLRCVLVAIALAGRGHRLFASATSAPEPSGRAASRPTDVRPPDSPRAVSRE